MFLDFFFFNFLLFYSDFIGKNKFPWLESVLPITVITE